MMKSSNPALGHSVFTKSKQLARSGEGTMTIQGTVNKTLLLFLCLLVTFAYSWSAWDQALRSGQNPPVYLLYVGMGGGFVLALITIFKQKWAPVTAPGYALFKGLMLGAASLTFEAQFPGIVLQAALGTLGVFAMMLMLYKSKIIKATENFKLGVAAATGGIFLLYLASFILGFFGVRIPFIHESGPIGIGFSVFVVGLAALNLVMDFDFIERGEEIKAPKFMEWYGAFGLLVTLIWLYLELLRLLAKLNRRD